MRVARMELAVSFLACKRLRSRSTLASSAALGLPRDCLRRLDSPSRSCYPGRDEFRQEWRRARVRLGRSSKPRCGGSVTRLACLMWRFAAPRRARLASDYRCVRSNPSLAPPGVGSVASSACQVERLSREHRELVAYHGDPTARGSVQGQSLFYDCVSVILRY